MLSADFQRGFCRAFLFVFIDRIKVKKRINEMGSCIYRFVHGSKKHTQIVIITKNIK